MSRLRIAEPSSFSSGFVSSGGISFGLADPVSEEERRLWQLEATLENQRDMQTKAERLLQSLKEEVEASESSVEMMKILVKQKKRQQQQSDDRSKQFENGFIPRDQIGISGVYVLSNDREIVYVGQSKNVYARIPQHAKKYTHYRVLPCSSRRRLYWEKVLISRYRPKLNRTKGTGCNKELQKKI